MRRCALALVLAAAACAKSQADTRVEPAPSASAAAVHEAPSAAPACPKLDVDEFVPTMTTGEDPVVPPLEDDAGAMDAFYRKLARLLRGKATDHVRIAVYGDSNGTMDFMTGEMRRELQTRYGDAGHGFYAVGQPWNWYRHQYVNRVLQPDTWESYTVTTHPTQDTVNGAGFYGHAMIVAQSKQGGATAWFSTMDADAGAPIGNTFDRLEVWYLKSPRFGTFEVKVDGASLATVDAHEGEVSVGFGRWELADAPHKLVLVAKESARPTRFLGVVFERSATKSIQVDGLGVGSLNCLGFLRDDPRVNAATLQRRNYDLVVFHVGTNTFFGDLGACMKKVMARHRAALPEASYLVMSPPDELESIAKPYKTAASVIKTSDDLHAVSKEEKTAWFDFRAAMGGDGAMGRFHDLDMSGEYVHFNAKGGAYMGQRVVFALWRGFRAWLAKHPDAGCTP